MPVVRKFSSADPPEPPVEGRNIPDYWIRPSPQVSTAAGLHRFVWDLHYPAPAASSFQYPISAIYRNTWREPRGPSVVPGAYTVRLTVEGHTAEQPLVVKMDPRVKTPLEGLRQQFTLSIQMYDDMALAKSALVAPASGNLTTERRAAVERVAGTIESLYGLLQEADLAPTPQVMAAVADAHAALAKLLGPVGSAQRSGGRPHSW